MPSIADVQAAYDDVQLRDSEIGRLIAANRAYIDRRFRIYDQVVSAPDVSRWRRPAQERYEWYRLYTDPPAGLAAALKSPFNPKTTDECVYCGSIDFAASIDHFLEKALFPEYALFPPNLVPVCGGCNPSLSAINGGIVHKVHPYLSDLLDRVLIKCRLSHKTVEGAVFQLYIQADHVSKKEYDSCVRHMEYLGINDRFIRYAGREWRGCRNVFAGFSFERAVEQVHTELRRVKDLHVNYWANVLYRAILEDENAVDVLRN